MIDIDLADYLNEDYFIPDVEASSQEELLQKMVAVLVDSGKIKSSSIVLQTLLTRESLGSTAIGRGIAIPHCRTLAVAEVFIVAALSQKGVEYNAPDKKKVHLIFLILAPPQEKANIYLPILGKLVERLRDAKKRKTLMNANDFRSFIQAIQEV
ncbi:MAG TPA: PTS sugar transporter subunit IIA [bacterium]|nr:PTS sugar transporter subunit IIA [bacterium]